MNGNPTQDDTIRQIGAAVPQDPNAMASGTDELGTRYAANRQGYAAMAGGHADPSQMGRRPGSMDVNVPGSAGEQATAPDPWTTAGVDVYRAALAHLQGAGQDPYEQAKALDRAGRLVTKFEGSKAAAMAEREQYLKLREAQKKEEFDERNLATKPTEREQFTAMHGPPPFLAGGGKLPPDATAHYNPKTGWTYGVTGKELPAAQQEFLAIRDRMFGGDAVNAQNFIKERDSALRSAEGVARMAELGRTKLGAAAALKLLPLHSAARQLEELVQAASDAGTWPTSPYRQRAGGIATQVATALGRTPKTLETEYMSLLDQPANLMQALSRDLRELNVRAEENATFIPEEMQPKPGSLKTSPPGPAQGPSRKVFRNGKWVSG